MARVGAMTMARGVAKERASLLSLFRNAAPLYSLYKKSIKIISSVVGIKTLLLYNENTQTLCIPLAHSFIPS